jgi:hypothetical protein
MTADHACNRSACALPPGAASRLLALRKSPFLSKEATCDHTCEETCTSAMTGRWASWLEPLAVASGEPGL